MAIEWTNNGSIRDISDLAADSLTPTSQAGGNMMSSNSAAMTAPGSEPVDPLPDRKEQGNPALDVPAAEMKPGTDGKPRARGGSGYAPGAPGWGKTTAPNVVRER